MRLLLDEQRKRFAPGEPFGFDPRLRVRPTSACWRKADEICSARVLLLMTDIVEKVSAKKLWNHNLKRTNPGEWILESTLRIFS